ncbi:MAG: sigma-70 region 4 domain-containing protein [Candidatus Micrarchaeota archaeon]
MVGKLTKASLTKKHGAVIRGLLEGLNQAQIAEREGVSNNTISQRFVKLKPFLSERTLTRINRVRALSPEVMQIVALKISGKSARQIAEQLGMKRDNVQSRINRAKKFLDTATLRRLNPRLTKKHGDIIRLRLAGKNYKEISNELGYNSGNAVYATLKTVLKYLHPRTIARLAIGIRTTPSRLATRQKIVDVFFAQLKGFKTGHGAVTATGKFFGVDRTAVKHSLKLAGVNVAGELQRKRLALDIQVSETMHLPVSQVAKQLEIRSDLVSRYRTRVRRGEHLRGALELVEHPDAQQWWNITPPGVSDAEVGPGRVNLTIRNETVQKDLQLFSDLAKQARSEARKWHPDNRETRDHPKRVEFYSRALASARKARAARSRYAAKEVAFREKYKLPVPSFLKLPEQSERFEK